MGNADATEVARDIDPVFERRRRCHACGERKRSDRLIYDECRERYDV